MNILLLIQKALSPSIGTNSQSAPAARHAAASRSSGALSTVSLSGIEKTAAFLIWAGRDAGSAAFSDSSKNLFEKRYPSMLFIL